jgi:hypothetical protein
MNRPVTCGLDPEELILSLLVGEIFHVAGEESEGGGEVLHDCRNNQDGGES